MMDVRRTLVWGLLGGGAVACIIGMAKTITTVPGVIGLDVDAYIQGARRLQETGSPYSEALRDGTIEHIAANIKDAYFYPPPLAQVFVVLDRIPTPVLVGLWIAVQVLILSLLLDALYTRANPSRTAADRFRLALLFVAFQPAIIALYIGNVSGWIAIAAGLAIIGSSRVVSAATVAVAWTKLTPGPFAVGAFLDPRTRWLTLAIGILLPLGSYLLAPKAWHEFVDLLSTLTSTPAAPTTINVSPSYVLSEAGFVSLAAVTSFALPAGFLLVMAFAALRGDVLGWVAAAAGAYLTATSTTWHHYLIVLVPIGLVAWSKASSRLQILILLTWLWYGPLWVFGDSTVHRLLGVGFWCAGLAWIGVEGTIRARIAHGGTAVSIAEAGQPQPRSTSLRGGL
jgi:hypothetical protein